MFSCILLSQSIYESYENYHYEVKKVIKQQANQVIDRVFPKIQEAEKWSWDSYNYGSIQIDEIIDDGNSENEKRIIIKGSFGFTRDGVFGKTTNRLPIMANGRITSSGTFYLKQLCYTEGRDKCHDPSKWNLESID